MIKASKVLDSCTIWKYSNIQEWEELSQDFNVKIIMDAAAASIDDLQVSKIIPTM